jgi:cytochrome c-type biogenesis protein CcmH
MHLKTFILIILLFFSLPASALEDAYAFTNTQEKNRFYNLLGELRCLVCQNQSLADSHSPLAEDLRREVYEMVQENKSNQQITEYLVSRYGNFVLYNPPFNSATSMLWIGPFALLILGTIVVFVSVRRHREKVK